MDVSPSTLILLVQVMLLLPLVLGIIGFIGVGVSPLRERHKFSQRMSHGTLIISILLLAISGLLITAPSSHYPLLFSRRLIFIKVDFHIDALSLYFIFLVNVIALFVSWNAIRAIDNLPGPIDNLPAANLLQHPSFFHASVNLFHFTMLLVPSVDNLIVLWFAIEATTLVSALLVGYRNTPTSWEAAWKYMIITSTGIILALLGTMFLANAIAPAIEGVATNKIMNWTFLMDKALDGSLAQTADFVKLSFLFILVGYGTKAGFAPMHTWLPDGHGEAPTPISALLSGVLLKSALYAILRFYTITNTTLQDSTFSSTILLGTGLLSLLLATPFILKENRFKRVLAYHSLEHMGIITFGIGIGGSVALFGALLHALNHAITKSLMFLSFGNVMRQYRLVGIEQKDITGILQSMPVTGTILALGGLALVGTPPSNIFMSELIILWGAISRLGDHSQSTTPMMDNWVVIVAVILFMLSTTLIFYGLVRHLGKLVLHKMPNDQLLEERLWSDIFPLALLLLLVLVFGLWLAPPLSDLLNRSVNIILNTQG